MGLCEVLHFVQDHSSVAGVLNKYFVYMLTNRSRVVLYTGVTNSLERPLISRQHGQKHFVKCYKLDRLVYYEAFDRAHDAISREKEIRGWCREKKNELVRKLNPKWRDLGKQLVGEPPYRSGTKSPQRGRLRGSG
ncbi:MAG TPA: GIY-YIG nuclease family protein [Chthoniobacterales bacterium]|nr:GIY-YIG nuclease family protein [Chthoniobacterales bacterium]